MIHESLLCALCDRWAVSLRWVKLCMGNHEQRMDLRVCSKHAAPWRFDDLMRRKMVRRG